MTLTFIPKLFVMFLVLVITGPHGLQLLVEFVTRLLAAIPSLVG
jgi:flagellar biosynthetic protein FliQ